MEGWHGKRGGGCGGEAKSKEGLCHTILVLGGGREKGKRETGTMSGKPQDGGGDRRACATRTNHAYPAKEERGEQTSSFPERERVDEGESGREGEREKKGKFGGGGVEVKWTPWKRGRVRRAPQMVLSLALVAVHAVGEFVQVVGVGTDAARRHIRDAKGSVQQAVLFGFVDLCAPGGRRRRGLASVVLRLALGGISQGCANARVHKSPGASVLGLLLCPDDPRLRGRIAMWANHPPKKKR